MCWLFQKKGKEASTYKYLGCVVNDRLGCSHMVEYRVEMESQALGAWLRCQESVVEVNRKIVLTVSILHVEAKGLLEAYTAKWLLWNCILKMCDACIGSCGCTCVYITYYLLSYILDQLI